MTVLNPADIAASSAAAGASFPGVSCLGAAGLAVGVLGFDAAKLQHHSVNIPVMVTYGMDLGPGRLFFGAGPTASIGVAYKYKDTVLGTTGDLYEDDNFGRFNLLMGIVGGYTISHIQFNFGYDWGLLDLDKTDGKRHQNLIHAGIAFAF